MYNQNLLLGSVGLTNMHLTVQLCQVLPESWGNASWEPAGIQRHSCGCTFTIFNLLIGWLLLRKIWTGFLPPLLYLHTFYWMYILGTQLMNVRRCPYKKDACTSEHSYVIICNTLGKLGWFLSFVKHVILYEKKILSSVQFFPDFIDYCS